MLITKYERVPFEVDVAPAVTMQNMRDIAEWCGGVLVKPEEKGARPYIAVDVKNAMNDRQTKAFVGDRVLKTTSGFKVFTKRAFERSFKPKEPLEVQHADTPIPNIGVSSGTIDEGTVVANG